MSLPSDVNADVAEAAQAMETRLPRARSGAKSLFRRLSSEQYGYAAAVLIAFVGVAVLGPRVRNMRRQRDRHLIDRVSRAADRAVQQAQRRARDMRAEAVRQAQRLGEHLPSGR